MQFELMTFVCAQGETFMEYEDLEVYKEETRDTELKKIVGYFEGKHVVDLEDCKENTGYVISYIASTGEHQLYILNNRLQLLLMYNNLELKDYINIFRLNDLQFVN